MQKCIYAITVRLYINQILTIELIFQYQIMHYCITLLQLGYILIKY